MQSVFASISSVVVQFILVPPVSKINFFPASQVKSLEFTVKSVINSPSVAVSSLLSTAIEITTFFPSTETRDIVVVPNFDSAGTVPP